MVTGWWNITAYLSNSPFSSEHSCDSHHGNINIVFNKVCTLAAGLLLYMCWWTDDFLLWLKDFFLMFYAILLSLFMLALIRMKELQYWSLHVKFIYSFQVLADSIFLSWMNSSALIYIRNWLAQTINIIYSGFEVHGLAGNVPCWYLLWKRACWVTAPLPASKAISETAELQSPFHTR